MALIVETGAGLTNSDSYVSLSAADAYLSSHGDNEAWFLESDERRERALRVATLYIDLLYSSSFRGRKTSSDQALEWPRFDAEDNSYYVIDSSTVPLTLARATAEAGARDISEADGLMPDVVSDSSGIKSESVSVGSISTSVTYAGVKREFKRFTIVDRLIGQLTNSGVVRRA
jgi:hypothetical protein